eukprot:scaffold612_cov343-Prasinococcus_capsulatus_cf.AAC.3
MVTRPLSAARPPYAFPIASGKRLAPSWRTTEKENSVTGTALVMSTAISMLLSLASIWPPSSASITSGLSPNAIGVARGTCTGWGAATDASPSAMSLQLANAGFIVTLGIAATICTIKQTDERILRGARRSQRLHVKFAGQQADGILVVIGRNLYAGEELFSHCSGYGARQALDHNSAKLAERWLVEGKLRLASSAPERVFESCSVVDSCGADAEAKASDRVSGSVHHIHSPGGVHQKRLDVLRGHARGALHPQRGPRHTRAVQNGERQGLVANIGERQGPRTHRQGAFVITPTDTEPLTSLPESSAVFRAKRVFPALAMMKDHPACAHNPVHKVLLHCAITSLRRHEPPAYLFHLGSFDIQQGQRAARRGRKAKAELEATHVRDSKSEGSFSWCQLLKGDAHTCVCI